MALLIILAVLFLGVALMVFFGERYGKPMTNDEQTKYGKITRILVFALLAIALIKGFMD